MKINVSQAIQLSFVSTNLIGTVLNYLAQNFPINAQTMVNAKEINKNVQILEYVHLDTLNAQIIAV